MKLVTNILVSYHHTFCNFFCNVSKVPHHFCKCLFPIAGVIKSNVSLFFNIFRYQQYFNIFGNIFPVRQYFWTRLIVTEMFNSVIFIYQYYWLLFRLSLFPFSLIGIHSMQGWTATMRHGVTRKRNTKRLRYTGNLFRKNLELKGVC